MKTTILVLTMVLFSFSLNSQNKIISNYKQRSFDVYETYRAILMEVLSPDTKCFNNKELVLMISPPEVDAEFSIRILENDSATFIEGIFLSINLQSFLFDNWKKIENISDIKPYTEQRITCISDNFKNKLLRISKELKYHEFIPPQADSGEIVDYSIPCYMCYFNNRSEKITLEASNGYQSSYAQDVYELFISIAIELKDEQFDEISFKRRIRLLLEEISERE